MLGPLALLAYMRNAEHKVLWVPAICCVAKGASGTCADVWNGRALRLQSPCTDCQWLRRAPIQAAAAAGAPPLLPSD
jgi:hypothetical protein